MFEFVSLAMLLYQVPWPAFSCYLQELVTATLADHGVCGDEATQALTEAHQHYRNYWEELVRRGASVLPTTSSMVVTVEPYIAVCGDRLVAVDGMDDEGTWALDFTPIAEWLSYSVWISEELSVEEGLAHILWEMSFHGTTDEQIQEAKDELEARTAVA